MKSIFKALVATLALVMLAAYVGISATLTFVHGSWLGCVMMELLLFGLLVMAFAGAKK